MINPEKNELTPKKVQKTKDNQQIKHNFTSTPPRRGRPSKNPKPSGREMEQTTLNHFEFEDIV